MEANYTITEDEYVRANKLFTKPTRKTLIAYAAACIALGIFALLTDSNALRFGALAAIVGGIFGDLFVRKVYGPIQTRKQYKSYKAAQEPTSVRKLDEGLSFKAAVGDAKIDWHRILKWRESSDFLLIYQAPQVYHIIPKRIGPLAIEISQSLEKNVGAAS